MPAVQAPGPPTASRAATGCPPFRRPSLPTRIPRKLRVANRAEATSRYLLLAYRRGGVPGER
jgi:hypothetical protein